VACTDFKKSTFSRLGSTFKVDPNNRLRVENVDFVVDFLAELEFRTFHMSIPIFYIWLQNSLISS
jgi:hypothetical protein